MSHDLASELREFLIAGNVVSKSANPDNVLYFETHYCDYFSVGDLSMWIDGEN